MGRPRLPHATRRGIAALLLCVLFAIPTPRNAEAQSLRAIALGRGASSRTPKLTQDDVDGLVNVSGELRVILNAPYEVWSSAGSYVHVAVYKGDFTPASSAVVYLDDRAVGITDSSGALTFRYQPPAPQPNIKAPSHYHVVTAIQGKGSASEARGRAGFETIPRRGPFVQERVVVYTDKLIYAPGDPIHMRAIAWKLTDSYTPVSGEPVHFQLRDNKRRVIGSGAAATSPRGVADFTLPLPPHAPEGVFEVLAEHNGQRALYPVLIEQRNTSLLTFDHTLPEFLDGADENVEFEVRLRSVYGSAPKKGRLRVRLRAGDATPFVQTIPATGAARYTFAWDITVLRQLKRTLKDGDLMYVDLAWQDDSGHTESVVHTMLYYAQPYTVTWGQAPNFVPPGAVASLPFQIFDRSNQPAPSVQVQVSTPSGVEPVTTDARGRATLKVPVSRWPMKVMVEVDGGLKSQHILGVAHGALTALIGTDTVQEGRPFPIEIALGDGLTPVGNVVHVNVTSRAGAITGAHLLKLRQQGDHFVASGSIPAPAWGTALITMFCPARKGDAAEAGLVVGGLEVEVAPASALKLTLVGAPRTVRPGQRVTIRGRVTDSRGTGRTSELSATIAEASAVAAVATTLSPGRTFYSGELPVVATTGETHLHWPVMSRTWGTARMDLVVPEEAAADRELRAFGRYYGGSGVTGKVAAEPKLDTHARARLQARRERRRPHRAPALSPDMTPPRTLLWTTLEARGGNFSVSFTVPDDPNLKSLQRLRIWASDDRGGVGTVEHSFTIDRPVVVEQFFPPTLTLGHTGQGRISVQNNGGQPLTATVSLKAPKEVLGNGATKQLEVGANDAAYVDFPLVGATSRTAKLEARVRGKNLSSFHQSTMEVEPVGVPVVSHAHGQAMNSRPYVATVNSPHRLSIRISVPYQGMVADTLDAVLNPRSEPLSVGSRSTSAYYLALYLNAFDLLTEERALAVRDVVAEDLVTILGELRHGKGIHSGKVFSPYLTARALQGLVAAQGTNFPVPEESIRLAGEAILRAVGKDGLLVGGDPVWWQGGGKERQLSLTAFTFRVLAEAGPEAVPVTQRDAFRSMQSRMRSVINLSSDPLTIAHAGMGLIAYSNNFLQVPLEVPIARRLLRRLREGRRDGHWKPSWFNSAVGTVSTTAHALELASLIDPEDTATWLQEALPKLEIARHALPAGSLGGATAGLMRLSSALAIPAEAQRTVLTVEINGRRVKRVNIDPNKPLASADALRDMDVAGYLRHDDANEIRVSYSGQLPATASLTTTRYEDSPPASPWTITRHVSATSLAPGDSATVTLTLTSGEPLANVVIEEPISRAWHVSRASLDQLVAKGQIASYELGDRLVLQLNGMGPKESIEYRVFAGTPGEMVLFPTRVHPRGSPEAAVIAGQATAITIR